MLKWWMKDSDLTRNDVSQVIVIEQNHKQILYGNGVTVHEWGHCLFWFHFFACFLKC